MKKLSYFRPSLVTKSIFPTYRDPAIVNEGECFIWAYSAFLIFDNVELYYVNCHAFVKYRKRFYDSEMLRGSTDWQDLPATSGCSCPPIKVSPQIFKVAWGDQPQRFNTSWRKIEASARRVLKNAQTSF